MVLWRLSSNADVTRADGSAQLEGPLAEDGAEDDDETPFPAFANMESDALSCLRPGILHRLDKGTTGERVGVAAAVDVNHTFRSTAECLLLFYTSSRASSRSVWRAN